MISIIMPVYNAERFLEEAIHSIQNQTFKEYELICINDASTDSTLDILKRMQEWDNRIKIYSNEQRSGAAISRNNGIKKAKGEYITFLDGDDIFEEEMLSIAYETVKGKNLDVLMYEYKHVASDEIYTKKSIPRSEEYIQRYCIDSFCIAEQSSEELLNWTTSPCNKLYRKDFIAKNKLEFQTLSSSNDVYFVMMALLLAERVMVLNDRRVMVYARDHFTPTRISFDRDPMCVYLAMEKVLIELINRGLLFKLYEHYYLRFYFMLIAGFRMAKSEEKKVLFYDFLKKEGIERLRNLGKEYYYKLDGSVREMLERFEKKEYLSNWYEKESTFPLFLKKNAASVIQLFENYKDIVIWGAGINGRHLLRFIYENSMVISAVVDKDVNKQGKIIEGYQIKAPEEISYQDDSLIVVSAREAYLDIKEQFSSKNVRIFFIGDYVREVV